MRTLTSRRALLWIACLALAAVPSVARADVSLGLELGQPTGVDLKLGVDRLSSLQVFLGWTDIWADHRDQYAHLTYLVTPIVGRGDAILVPLRFGLGVAFYGDGSFEHGLNMAARVPIELALRFRHVPLELYGEIAAMLTFYDQNNNTGVFDVQGGVGLRVYL